MVGSVPPIAGALSIPGQIAPCWAEANASSSIARDGVESRAATSMVDRQELFGTAVSEVKACLTSGGQSAMPEAISARKQPIMCRA
jgi:hypothetical protein